LPYGTDYVDKPVIIERNVWLGNHVIIVPGVHIGEGAIIAMGSVVTKNVSAGAVVGGNPAEVLKFRDPDAYKKLESEGRYLNDIRGRVKVPPSVLREVGQMLDATGEVNENDLSRYSKKIRSTALYQVALKTGSKFTLTDNGYKVRK